MSKKILWLLLLLIWAKVSQAQKNDSLRLEYASTITAEELKAHLQIIASDEYEGRNTGSRGQKKAADYIYRHFQQYGLTAPVTENTSNPYFQPFLLSTPQLTSDFILCGKNNLKAFTDFYPLVPFSLSQEMEAVFVGNGEEKDYELLDPSIINGKMVVIAVAGESDNTMRKTALAKKMGARVVAFVDGGTNTFSLANFMSRYYYSEARALAVSQEKNPIDVIFINPKKAHKLFQIAKKDWLLRLSALKSGKPVKEALLARVNIKLQMFGKPIETENVLGFIEGSDKKDEIVVVSGHYDHLGVINGKIYNGADDNGSGTVALLEMAQAFAKAKAAGHGPRRSILFMAFSAEEKGLKGSEYYTNVPVFPLEKTVVDLNVDMIGRIDQQHTKTPFYTYIIGSDKLSSELHQLSEQIAARDTDVRLDYGYNADADPNRFYYRSDHYNFAKNNIPIIFYFNGTHADYHQPGDDVDKINFEKMAKVSRLIFLTAWEVANREKRIAVDKAHK